MENPLLCQKMTNYESSCTSITVNYVVKKKSYGPNHPNQMDNEYYLLMMMLHAYTYLSLVEGEAFPRMATHLDLYI